jgi:hypothetical protein
MTTERNPFDGLDDKPELDTAETRSQLFTDAKRGFVRIRKDFVQRPSKPRPSILADFVTGRKERALDLLLTIHALQPILDGTPLALATWARLLDSEKRPCTTRAVTSTLRVLEEMDLLHTEGPKTAPDIVLHRENGDGALWTKERPDAASADPGRGFFTVPFHYWTEGTIDRLRLPGKAMFLILLKETQDPAGPLTFTMPVERASEWYGISERTAERGYLELSKRLIIRQHVQKIPDARHPAGRKEVHHRALAGHYSTDYREFLRDEAQKASTGAK